MFWFFLNRTIGILVGAHIMIILDQLEITFLDTSSLSSFLLSFLVKLFKTKESIISNL